MNTKQITKPVSANKPASKPAAKAETKPAAASKKAETKPETKPASKPAATVKLFVPRNRPTAGALLFAYTHAAMAIVLSMPKAKQETIARQLHGERALRYHGPAGTGYISFKDGAAAYTSHFGIGPKAMDEKRRAVPASWSDAFAEYIKTGKLGKALDGFAWKPAGDAAAVLEVGK